MKITVNDVTTSFDRGARQFRFEFSVNGVAVTYALLTECMAKSPSFVDGWARQALSNTKKAAQLMGVAW